MPPRYFDPIDKPKEQTPPPDFSPESEPSGYVPANFENGPAENRNQQMSLLFASGMSTEDIAKTFDLSTGHVATLRKSPLMIAIVRKVQENFQQIALGGMLEPFKEPMEKALNTYAPDAIKQIAFLMEGAESDSVKLNAATEILDRSPEAPKKVKQIQQETRTIAITLGPDEVRRMANSAIELGESFDSINIEGMLQPVEQASKEVSELAEHIENEIPSNDFIRKAIQDEQDTQQREDVE